MGISSICKSSGLHTKRGENAFFRHFFLPNIWWVQKKAVPLHPLSRREQVFLTFCGNSSVGRARPCQGRGREFESRLPLKEGSRTTFLLFYSKCSPGGGIGRRVRFRCVCREACRFESCSGHKSGLKRLAKTSAGGEIGIHATLRG